MAGKRNAPGRCSKNARTNRMSVGQVIPQNAMIVFLAMAASIALASTLPVSLVGNGRNIRPRINATSHDAAGMPNDLTSGVWDSGRITHASSPKNPSATATVRSRMSSFLVMP